MRQDQFDDEGVRIPFTNFQDFRKLMVLVHEPDCDTRAGVITIWRDARPQPTYDEIEAVPDATADDYVKEQEALNLSDVKKVVTSMLEILYENPDLVASFANVGALKGAVKDRFKSKL